MLLRNQEDQAGRDYPLRDRPAGAPAQIVWLPRGAVARSTVTERVDVLARMILTHLVRQDWDRAKEVHRGNGGLQAASVVAVAFDVDLFEVQAADGKSRSRSSSNSRVRKGRSCSNCGSSPRVFSRAKFGGKSPCVRGAILSEIESMGGCSDRPWGVVGVRRPIQRMPGGTCSAAGVVWA